MECTSITTAYHFLELDARLATAGQPTESQLASAATAGFEVVINLAFHDNPRYSLKDEPGLVKSLGMEYTHIPVPFDAPSEAELSAFFQTTTAHQ